MCISIYTTYIYSYIYDTWYMLLMKIEIGLHDQMPMSLPPNHHVFVTQCVK